jgi:hypothetical protein
VTSTHLSYEDVLYRLMETGFGVRVHGNMKTNEQNTRLMFPKNGPLNVVIIVVDANVLIVQCVCFVVSPSTVASSDRMLHPSAYSARVVLREKQKTFCMKLSVHKCLSL